MRTSLLGFVALGLLAPAWALAASPFDGTWKIDIAKAQMPEKPDEYLLTGGMYTCKTCAPGFTVAADGKQHAVTGQPYYDSVAIKVVDDHTIQRTSMKGGKVVATSTMTIAADGKTASFEFTDRSDTNAAPVSGKGTDTRVGAAPAGAHAISGAWRTTAISGYSDNGLLVTYKANGEMMSLSQPTGQSYTAKMDGTATPYKGDPGINQVSVKKISDHEITESYALNGKVVSFATMTVSEDGKTMKTVFEDRLRGQTSSFTATKQ
jgi:hypothetical protein